MKVRAKEDKNGTCAIQLRILFCIVDDYFQNFSYPETYVYERGNVYNHLHKDAQF